MGEVQPQEQGLKQPPAYNPQVQMHIWIDEIRQPPRILIRVEDNAGRGFMEIMKRVQHIIGLTHGVPLGQWKVLSDDSIEATIDL